MVSSRQLRAARALLGWTQKDLAERSGFTEITIMRMERVGLGRSYHASAEKVIQTLEAEGVVFTLNGGVDLKVGKQE